MIEDLAQLISIRAKQLIKKTGKDIDLLGIKKENGEIYIFLYDNLGVGECLRTIRKYASDPDLESFTEIDADKLSHKLKSELQKEHEKRFSESMFYLRTGCSLN